MKNIFLIIFFTVLTGNLIYTQSDVYSTKSATMHINGGLNGEALHLSTQELRAVIDYETANIRIKFSVSSLHSEVDSLNKMISNIDLDVVFEGNLGLEYVNTENHPPMKLKTEGWLTIGDSKTLVRGEGELHHIGNAGQIACILGMTMELSFDQLGIQLPIPGLEEEFEIVITQALLQ